jgi:hypothetical protein
MHKRAGRCSRDTDPASSERWIPCRRSRGGISPTAPGRIVPVHIYGKPCDMDPINRDRRRHGPRRWWRDACQAWTRRVQGPVSAERWATWAASASRNRSLQSTCPPDWSRGGGGGALRSTGQAKTKSSFRPGCHSFHELRPLLPAVFKGNQARFSRAEKTNYRMQHFQAVAPSSSQDRQAGGGDRPLGAAMRTPTTWPAQLAKDPGVQRRACRNSAGPFWHLFPLRYDRSTFSRCYRATSSSARFNAEGIPLRLAATTEQYQTMGHPPDEAIRVHAASSGSSAPSPL